MDLLSKYEIYPINTLSDHVQHTFENYDVQFERYLCPFFCKDISIPELDVSG